MRTFKPTLSDLQKPVSKQTITQTESRRIKGTVFAKNLTPGYKGKINRYTVTASGYRGEQLITEVSGQTSKWGVT